MLRLIRYALIAALPLLLLLAACSGDDDDDSGGDTTATATNAIGDPTETEDAGEPTGTDDSGDDDGAGEPGGYYDQFADIVNQADVDVDEIASQYGGPYDDDQDEIEQTQTAITETGRVVEQVLLDLSDLEPPPTAESAHTTYLEVLQEALINYASLSADLEDVSNGADLDAIIDQYSPLVQERNQGVEDACIDIQDLADAAGSTADLGCTE